MIHAQNSPIALLHTGRERPARAPAVIAEIRQPLALHAKLWKIGAVRRSVLLAILALGWQVYASWLHRPLMLPTFGATVTAFVDSLIRGELLLRAAMSLKILIVAYAAGVVLAGLLAAESSTVDGKKLLISSNAVTVPKLAGGWEITPVLPVAGGAHA